MAQRDSKKETIGEHKYEVFMLPPKVANRMLVEMLKAVGPALGEIVDGTEGGLKRLLDEKDTTNVKVAKAIESLVANLDADTLDRHMATLASVTHANGAALEPTFDLHFMGDLPAMYKWYFFALRANFGNFSSALASVSAALPSKAARQP